MATTISTQDIVDAKRDIEDIGKAVNEKVIVSPRYGEDFKSLPMIAAEFQDAINTIVVEDGVPALAVSDASGVTQQEINDTTPRKIDYNIIVNVGSAETHKTINSALEYLTGLTPCYIRNDASLRAKILLKSGFVAKEQININGLHLNWIDISSEDAEVQVDRTFLTDKDDRWCYFLRCKNGSIPNIDTLFSLQGGVADDDSTGLYMNHSNGFINPYKGFKNFGTRNVDLTQSSTLACARGIFTGAGVLNFRPATGSIVFMQFADVSGAPTGLSTSTGAAVSAANLVCNNCSTGVSIQCAKVDLTEAVFTNNTAYSIRGLSAAASINAPRVLINDGNRGISAENGAIINADNAKINNQTVVGLLATNGSKIIAQQCELLGNATGVISLSGSTVVITGEGTKINDSASYSLNAQTGGTIVANDADYRKTAGVDSNTDARVASGGTIIALNGIGGNSQKPNKRTVNGVIDKGGLAQNNGNAVITSGTKSIVVNHGLSETPITVIAVPNGDISPATKWWVGYRTDTTFTITVDVELTASMQFYWTASI